jgi:hypothetical protein
MLRIVDAPAQLVALPAVVDTDLLLYAESGHSVPLVILDPEITQSARRRPVHLEYRKCDETAGMGGGGRCTGSGAGVG